MLAAMFPGQGAQRLSMGNGLFERFPQLCREADDILGYSLRSLCMDGPIERLTETQYTQPALYVVNALEYLAFMEDGGEKPDYLLGHSVSEYVALFAAGVLDFASGLRLVQKRGALMAEAKGGGMAAVLGLTAEQVEDIIAREGLTDIFAANYNTPKQIVISGKKETILAAELLFQNAGAMLYKVLAVSGAFHSPFMKESQQAFAELAKGLEFKTPQTPVISNVTARPHLPADIRAKMIEQITAPVKWSESIRYLLAKGLEVSDFKEIGPKGPPILQPMVKRTQLEAGPLDAETLKQEEEAKRAGAQAKSAPADKKETVTSASVKAASPLVNGKLNGVHKPATKPSVRLGSQEFCNKFGLKYPYVSGAMYRGIASADMVIKMANAGMLGFLGAGGMPIKDVEENLAKIQASVAVGQPYGVNFISHFNRPHAEEALTDVLLKYAVPVIEASAFMEVSPALVRYRAKGLSRTGDNIHVKNRIIAKVSRPDIAANFLSPPPDKMLDKMVSERALTAEEASMLRLVPMADAVTVESDSGGHTDQGNPFNLIPAVLSVRKKAQERFPGFGPIFVGAGGGIGTPEAAAAVFMLGADYIVSGSINQCTVEAGTSDAVKDLLAAANVYDTGYAPSGAMFELGSKIQVLKKGLFFPSRAEKLVSLYNQSGSIDEIDTKLAQQIQERYFKRSFNEVLSEIRERSSADDWRKVETNPRYKMSQIIRCYYSDTTMWALSGNMDHKVDFQIHCGPAMGAVNQWLKDTELEDWRKRSVDALGKKLLSETAELYGRRLTAAMQGGAIG
ncbi:ACP S-malonyltransferase [Kordiimonas pumila]|uniref:[acyl-carrier-protein] S-malonyltransferase n=1 Tax=Kordiimonas pumila TaxID=2161677 RepID=A0ABV7D347_9PROT|nr:ACP S-malonyltransferase [Kordiimonas pumila]